MNFHKSLWKLTNPKFGVNKNIAFEGFNDAIEVQWGSEYQPFEYPKQLNTKLFEVLISNGLVFKWSVY